MPPFPLSAQYFLFLNTDYRPPLNSMHQLKIASCLILAHGQLLVLLPHRSERGTEAISLPRPPPCPLHHPHSPQSRTGIIDIKLSKMNLAMCATYGWSSPPLCRDHLLLSPD